jgi:hypothetical protein
MAQKGQTGYILGRFLQGVLQGIQLGTELKVRKGYLDLYKQQADQAELDRRIRLGLEGRRNLDAQEARDRAYALQVTQQHMAGERLGLEKERFQFEKDIKTRPPSSARPPGGDLEDIVKDTARIAKLLVMITGDPDSARYAPDVKDLMQATGARIDEAWNKVDRVRRADMLYSAIRNDPDLGPVVENNTYPTGDPTDPQTPWINGDEVAAILRDRFKALPTMYKRFEGKGLMTPNQVIIGLIDSGLGQEALNVFKELTKPPAPPPSPTGTRIHEALIRGGLGKI